MASDTSSTPGSIGLVRGFFYRRPAYVRSESIRTDSDTKSVTASSVETDLKADNASSTNSKSLFPGGIPEALSFDKIISDGACPPLAVRDFMNFLIYVERSAENLQFYLWWLDYCKRWVRAKSQDIRLAPSWTETMEKEALARIQKDMVQTKRNNTAAASVFKGTDFEKCTPEVIKDAGDPFSTPPQTPDDASLAYTQSYASTYKAQASEAFEKAGTPAPFTIMPFHDEVSRIISTYIAEGGSRELNLSATERKLVMHALSVTTHPSAFRPVVKIVETMLRQQAHPNFIRWSICNGNPARVAFARGLGAALILIGFVIATLLTVSGAGRGYRALAAIAWVLGVSTLVAAYKGMCVVLHGLHHRHVRPWELFEHDEEGVGETQLGVPCAKMSVDSTTSNSYEDEPWVVRYHKRNIVRKVFDREVWIREPALRQIQDIIFAQAMLTALVAGGVLTAIFVCLPAGNRF